MLHKALAALFTMSVAAALVGVAAQERPARATPVDAVGELLLRHPELPGAPGYSAFATGRKISGWTDRAVDRNGLHVVSVYGSDDAIYAALIARARTGEKSVRETHAFAPDVVRSARGVATAALKRERSLDFKESDEVVPYARKDDNTWTLWFEFALGPVQARKRFQVDAKGTVIPLGGAPPKLMPVKASEDLASNELHHVAVFATRPLVLAAATRTTTLDQVLDILEGLNASNSGIGTAD